MTRNKWLAALLGMLISIIFLWIAFRNLKPDEVWSNIREANPVLLVIAAGWYFTGVTVISLRWRFLLRSIRRIPLRNLIPLVCIGYAGNNIYPFRSGEILRIVLLQRDHGVRIAQATTTVIVERIFDGLVMLTFILVPLLFLDVPSPEVRMVAAFAAPIFLTALAVFFILAARPNLLRRLLKFVSRILPERLKHFLFHIGEEIIEGLEALRTPGDLAGAVASSFLSWALEASVYWIVSIAFNLGVSYPTMLLVVGVVNLAGLIPASPGQFGVFEFFVSTVLIAVAVPETQAQAFALVVHMVIWLPVTLVGLFFLARQGLGLGAITQVRDLEQRVVS
jgi:glycosyltransferase 2 family protein